MVVSEVCGLNSVSALARRYALWHFPAVIKTDAYPAMSR